MVDFRKTLERLADTVTDKRKVTTYSTTTNKKRTSDTQKLADALAGMRGEPSRNIQSTRKSDTQKLIDRVGGRDAATSQKATDIFAGVNALLNLPSTLGRLSGAGMTANAEHWQNPANRLPGAEGRASLMPADPGDPIASELSFNPLASIDPSLYDIDVDGIYDEFKLEAPDLAAYLAPFVEARKAADSTYQAGKGEISAADRALRADLAETQAAGNQALANRDRERLLRRSQMQSEQSQDLATSGLAADLGLGDELGQQAALLRMTQRQADLGSDNLAAEIASGQDRNFNDRLQSADQQTQAAFANAALNLQAIMQQIAGGEADAKRQHTNDVNDVNRSNLQLRQQLEAQDRDLNRQLGEIQMGAQVAQAEAQRDATRFQQEQAAAEQDYANTQMEIRAQATVDPWERRVVTENLYGKNPKAIGFFDDYVNHVIGGKRDATSKAKALANLNTNIQQFYEQTGTKLNASILSQWLNDYYSEPVVDERKFLAMGGDPAFL